MMRAEQEDRGRSPIQRVERARRDPALAVLEGFHPLKHALRFGATIEEAWAIDPQAALALAAALAPDLVGRLRELTRPLAPALLTRLAPVPPATGVIAIARRPAIDVTELLSGELRAPVVLLENPAHLGNLGAVVRVAAAAGATAVLTTGRQDPWHPAALRGSAGLHFALPVARIEALPQTARPLIALHPEGEPLSPDAIPDDALLAFGSERRGLGRELLERAQCRLAIPMRAGVSSLNLASAVAVALYAWRLGRPSRR
jgi:RNA methyltransferase, TrmH family